MRTRPRTFQGGRGRQEKREVEKDDADAVERQAQAAEDKRRKHEELVMHPVCTGLVLKQPRLAQKQIGWGFHENHEKFPLEILKKIPAFQSRGEKSPVFRVFRVFRVPCFLPEDPGTRRVFRSALVAFLWLRRSLAFA